MINLYMYFLSIYPCKPVYVKNAYILSPHFSTSFIRFSQFQKTLKHIRCESWVDVHNLRNSIQTLFFRTNTLHPAIFSRTFITLILLWFQIHHAKSPLFVHASLPSFLFQVCNWIHTDGETYDCWLYSSLIAVLNIS